MTAEQIASSIAHAEERLGRRLDEVPRPHLVGHPDDPPDVFEVDLDAAITPAPPGAQHAALWLTANDLFARRDAALRAIDARIAVDPYATLDVVLAPRRNFPIDLLDLVRARLDAAPASYASRMLAHRGEDLQRRIAVVLRGEATREWIDAVRASVPVFRDQRFADALRNAERLGADLPCARIVDSPPPGALPELARRADPECVAFVDRALEREWQARVLGYSE
jgi:hypothetical protein